MTMIWVIVWLLHGDPALYFSPTVNGWATWLLIAAALDLGGSATTVVRRR